MNQSRGKREQECKKNEWTWERRKNKAPTTDQTKHRSINQRSQSKQGAIWSPNVKPSTQAGDFP